VAVAHPDKKIEVLAGTNLPMIVTGVTMIDFEEDPAALAEELLTTGKEFMVRFQLAVREEEDEESDGI
jgi:PTS system N-acetylgalactosamine-specific IIA component